MNSEKIDLENFRPSNGLSDKISPPIIYIFTCLTSFFRHVILNEVLNTYALLISAN